VFKKGLHFFAFLLVISSLISCKETTEPSSLYYPIDSLIQSQVYFLAQSNAILNKKAEIDGKEETNSFTPKDSAAWAHELDIFSELEVINKPIHAGNYRVENGLKDTNSNLTITSFTSTGQLPVVYLKIFYLEVPSKIRRIEALYQEENSLLKGSRLLIMEFEEINNNLVLTSFSIEGGQKMFLGDSVKFSVKGTVTLP
jgi:hypothetical protein